ncbi:hypothetical protein ACO0QE_003486 [Hanseniaspora vineae]
MARFYCEYCRSYLTHDKRSVLKAHITGKHHIRLVKDYYRNKYVEQWNRARRLDKRKVIRDHTNRNLAFAKSKNNPNGNVNKLSQSSSKRLQLQDIAPEYKFETMSKDDLQLSKLSKTRKFKKIRKRQQLRTLLRNVDPFSHESILKERKLHSFGELSNVNGMENGLSVLNHLYKYSPGYNKVFISTNRFDNPEYSGLKPVSNPSAQTSNSHSRGKGIKNFKGKLQFRSSKDNKPHNDVSMKQLQRTSRNTIFHDDVNIFGYMKNSNKDRKKYNMGFLKPPKVVVNKRLKLNTDSNSVNKAITATAPGREFLFKQNNFFYKVFLRSMLPKRKFLQIFHGKRSNMGKKYRALELRKSRFQNKTDTVVDKHKRVGTSRFSKSRPTSSHPHSTASGVPAPAKPQSRFVPQYAGTSRFASHNTQITPTNTSVNTGSRFNQSSNQQQQQQQPRSRFTRGMYRNGAGNISSKSYRRY